MSIVTVILTLLLVGGLLWVINHYLPLEDKMIKVINVVVAVAVVAWLIMGFL